ncbi:hypothetical protein Pla111_10680 [Botrimarina hoheduenensis]|uniref:Uncharacterized protein n=2 Tax=Botrimarina hoheduenensis TaxID=2528000 RepID=A0A5C5WA18_9BACT|nr:hypothetical protein Pla111_10680 [Botrimarina hoheduenensis]
MDPVAPEIAEIRSLAQRSQGLLSELRAKTSEKVERQRAGVEKLGSEASRLIEEVAAAIAGELAAELTEQHDQRSQEDSQRFQEENAAFQAERSAWEAERSEWNAVRDEIEAELAGREEKLRADSAQQLAEAGAAAAKERAEIERLLDEQRNEANALRAEALRLTEALDKTSREHAEVAGKFEMALTDLQSHRERVGELEQIIAERPEPGVSQGAELAQLRHERDQLIQRVEELEAGRSSADPSDADSNEIEDLRRRFEMAVEDVRALKNEKAELEDQLARSTPSKGIGAIAEGNDWESQKRRLLAELEGEGEPENSERTQERATIAGTIQITDGVVAEKDREIAQLRESLEQAGCSSDNEVRAALLDEDEIILKERERLSALEASWQEKLRQAELELSLERAKIARSQNALAEQQIELETLRAAVERAASETGPSGEARQNWLKKLGLGSDGSA